MFFRNPPVAELYLVRHAQASFHSADYDCLSALGERQSRWLGEYFASRGIRFDVLITGTLRRHRQTLAGILEGMELDAAGDAIELPGLDEYDFRALVAAFAAANPDDARVAAWRAEPAAKPAFYRLLKLAMLAWSAGELPGPLPETWADFMQRTTDAGASLQALTARGSRLLAISSGGAMSALLGARLGLSPAHIADLNMQVRNTSVSHFHLNRERFLLSSWNAVPHLERAGREDAITYG
jgi:broad specificity phosphatase PhoE